MNVIFAKLPEQEQTRLNNLTVSEKNEILQEKLN